MNTHSTRRNAIKIGFLAGLSAFGMAACDSVFGENNTGDNAGDNTGGVGGGGVGERAEVNSAPTLRLLFWGTATRNTLTQNAQRLYHDQHTNTTITSSYSTFGAYWGLLDQQIAAGKVPDLFQMDMRHLSKYVREERMLDLTQLIYEQTIDLSDFDPLMLAGSKANNALYGIPLGGNCQCLLYDTVLLERAGIGVLPDEMSWEIFAEYMLDIGRTLGKGVYGVGDASGDITVYEIWIRQHGKELYTVEGRLGFTVEDIAAWFAYWDMLRASGGCVPSNVSSNDSSGGNSPLIRGKSVFIIPHSNEFESFQALTPHPLAFHDMPTGAMAGLYLKPSLLISIAAQTPFVQEAANFINFLVNDPQGIKAIGIERGIPGSPRAQALLYAGFTAAQRQEVAFVNALAGSANVRLKEVLDPPVADQVATLFQQAANQVAKKQSTVLAGANTFYSAAMKVTTQ